MAYRIRELREKKKLTQEQLYAIGASSMVSSDTEVV